MENINYTGYGPSKNMSSVDLTGSSANYDWGVYNSINNGGNTIGQWRTLTMYEWEYVFNTRQASMVNGTDNARYVKANVNNVQGIILFPDNYTHPLDVAQPIGINENGNTGLNGNNYSLMEFALMEDNGVVFLPSAGSREGNMAGINVGTMNCSYWSTTSETNTSVSSHRVYANKNMIESQISANSGTNRWRGQSVRLVHDVQ